MASLAATYDPEFYKRWSSPEWRRDLQVLVRNAIVHINNGSVGAGYGLWKYLSVYGDQKRACRRYGLTEEQVHSWLVNSLRLFLELARSYKVPGTDKQVWLKATLYNVEIVKELAGIGVVTWD